ncbi:ATP-dependent DNA helicase 2 subunit KU80 [Acorus calamus]|uniref:ATP-dependent DNA helicase 2 subunit KU80 n=1 Tax=Acorus calamus TaxID=4465 RepID=A0AAV9DRL7_ACOCL|nr:ATP-dependent DNA helicase 2 subunit KU80 [Acorus calamus]
MAPKESLVLLVDVGPLMHGVLTEIETFCSMLVQKKLIYSKTDEVGIVFFGTEDTNNELEVEVGGYEHVFVQRKIEVVNGHMVEDLQNLPRGTTFGDFMDAIVVGMDMLIKKYGPTNKGKQRLCLITDARHPIKDPDEGTKEDQVDTISSMMKARGVRMDCLIVREKLDGNANKSIVDENDRLLNHFSRRTIAKTIFVGRSASLSGAVRTRNISPVTIYRGDLELSPAMKIKVWVYKKTSQERLPTLKKYSDKAPPTDKFATHEVKVDFEYKSIEDPNKVVPPEQRIKGYRYGPQVVPISLNEWEAVRFKPDKSVKLLGFTDASNIMRHYYMKEVNVFIPEPGNSRAILAVSALARAMKEMNKVAILRCVWRNGQGSVVVGVLSPNISSQENIPDSFYFNVLPFAEDIREFQFPSFSSFPSSLQPTVEQQEAADNLVKMLDLKPSGGEEALLPDFTPNPVLMRFYHVLELKSRNPDADVPPVDRCLKRILEPDSELLSQNKPTIDKFGSQFELKENPKKKKSSKRHWRDRLLTSNDDGETAKDDMSEIRNSNVTNDSSAVKVDKIGNSTPVQDFNAMMARRDSPEWISRAFREMKNYINDILENSYEGDTFLKAVDCLEALRRGCILEQEPKEFNQFLFDLYEKWKNTDLVSFFELVSSKNITLISKTEAEDSDIMDDEAKIFLPKSKPPPQ